MGHLITGLLFLAIGMALTYLQPWARYDRKKPLLANMLKSNTLWGNLFMYWGLTDIGIYCFDIETITWKNGIFLLISILSIAHVIGKIIEIIKQYRETEKRKTKNEI